MRAEVSARHRSRGPAALQRTMLTSPGGSRSDSEGDAYLEMAEALQPNRGRQVRTRRTGLLGCCQELCVFLAAYVSPFGM